MKKQFSLAHLTVLGCAPPEMIYIAARAGYDFVSFRPILRGTPNEPKYALAEDKVMMHQTKVALADTGLKVLDIELARIDDGIDPKIYLPAMEVAAELGGRHILSSAWTADRNFVVESYAELCDMAKPFGLTVDFEFVTWAAVSTLKQAIDILHNANRENCGIMLDMLHFYRSRVRPEELDEVPREWFHFAHLCDGPEEIPTAQEALIHTGRDERLYVGEGSIDIAGILNRIPEIPCSIELPHIARAKEFGYAEHAWRCLQTAKDYFAAHPRG